MRCLPPCSRRWLPLPSLSGGWDVAVAMLVALAIGLRFSSLWMLLAGWLVVMAIRHLVM